MKQTFQLKQNKTKQTNKTKTKTKQNHIAPFFTFLSLTAADTKGIFCLMIQVSKLLRKNIDNSINVELPAWRQKRNFFFDCTSYPWKQFTPNPSLLHSLKFLFLFIIFQRYFNNLSQFTCFVNLAERPFVNSVFWKLEIK